jgi:hypothetical protein
VKAGGLDENQINNLDKIAKNEVKLIKMWLPWIPDQVRLDAQNRSDIISGRSPK